MPTPISGVNSYIQYDWETTYGTQAAGTFKAFGQGHKISVSRKNNAERIYGLGSRDAQKLVVKQFEGTFSVDFVGASGYWWRSILGAAPVDAGAGPYTHTYSRADNVGSFTIENGFNLDTDKAIFLLGCKANTASVTAAVNEVIKIKLDGAYKDEDVSGTIDTTPATDAEEPFVFQHATLEIPDTTTITEVQSVDISVTNNQEGVYGLGSRFRSADVSKQFEVSLKLSVAFEQTANLLELFWGGSGGPVASPGEIATAQLTLDNGGVGTASRKWVINLVGLQIDDESLPQDPNEVIKEDLTLFARQISSVVITDNTAVAP